MVSDFDPLDTRSITGSVRVEVYLLPDFYSDGQYKGRSDLGVKSRRKIGQLNDTQDLEGTVRKLATAPGAYIAECKAGRDTLESGVFEIQPRGQALRIDGAASIRAGATQQTTTEAQTLAPTPAPETSSAHSINATTETIRATKELLKEVAPPPPVQPAPTLTREEVAQIIAEQLRQLKPNTSATVEKPKTLKEQLQELRDAKELLTELQPPTPTQNSGVDALLETLDRADELRERFAPSGINPDASTFDKILSTVDSVSRAAQKFAPTLLTMLAARNAATAGAMHAPQQHPLQSASQPDRATRAEPPTSSQPPSVQNAPEAVAGFALPAPVVELIDTICLNCKRDDGTEFETLETTAELISDFAERNPMYAPVLTELLALPPLKIILTVVQYTPHNAYLLDLPHSGNYFNWLKVELNGDEADAPDNDDESTPSVNASNNGAGTLSAAQ